MVTYYKVDIQNNITKLKSIEFLFKYDKLTKITIEVTAFKLAFLFIKHFYFYKETTEAYL